MSGHNLEMIDVSYRLLDTCLSMLPPDRPYFYMYSLDKFPSHMTKCAVTKQRVGVNILKGILSELSEKSGVGVHYTNHSLRAMASITHTVTVKKKFV